MLYGSGGSAPFSFRYAALSSREEHAGWQWSPGSSGTGDCATCVTTDGLKVAAEIRVFGGYDAEDWLLRITNTGAARSALLANVLAMDHEYLVPADGTVTLHYANGSRCVASDFLPQTRRLRPGEEIVLEPVGGRSSDGVLPFVNLQWPGGGEVIAVGWTGQWFMRVARESDDSVRVSVGQRDCSLRLEPGESFRTPRVLRLAWSGDDAETGNNMLRRFLLEHIVPRKDGEPALPPISHNRQLVYYHTGRADEADHLAAVPRAAELGIELFWMDALWYGRGTGTESWAGRVGDWRVDTERFPRGLKPIADAAHAAGMRYMLWFEPERVRPSSLIAKEHPEFLLSREGDSNLLLDLGNPAAREYILETISALISEAGIDIYRQDFNFEPLGYWRAADASDRVGMTEIRHIEGLYWLWDELKRRHPGLLIDNCSSGGRRIDYETTSRSFPLWRSDFTDAGALHEGHMANVGAQVQSVGLSRWVPLHAASVYDPQPYNARSTMSTGVCFYSDIMAEDYDEHGARGVVAEVTRLRPLMLGDLYLLSPLTTEAHDWCAYQFHVAGRDAGFAVFLRRDLSCFSRMTVSLRGIDSEARYRVSMSQDFLQAAPIEMRGGELLALEVAIHKAPGSILLEYQKL